eukprot:COSAG05_NODE_16038_length_355_cov_0.417969_1_plen_77_part_10
MRRQPASQHACHLATLPAFLPYLPACLHVRAYCILKRHHSRRCCSPDAEAKGVEGDARMQQARSKLSVMVRLHNETT